MLLHIFHHSNSQLHFMGNSHLEAPRRTVIIGEAMEQADYPTKFIMANPATQQQILDIHHQDLYHTVAATQEKDMFVFTPDTIANRRTFEASLTAVGGAIQVSETLEKNHSFAMLRPPGHHATFDLAMGFCFFNNIAVAASSLLKRKYKKIAIIDIDNHHGNGTQQIFADNPQVLYTSLHADPHISFPGTGHINEIGFGDGEGKTVNVPLPYQTGDRDWLYAFDAIVKPIVREFKPDVILISLGLDGLLGDPYGSLGLSTDGFLRIGHEIGTLATELTKKRVGTILEGGYKYEEIGLATANFFKGLQQAQPQNPVTQGSQQIQEIVFKARALQRNYWYEV